MWSVVEEALKQKVVKAKNKKKPTGNKTKNDEETAPCKQNTYDLVNDATLNHKVGKAMIP